MILAPPAEQGAGNEDAGVGSGGEADDQAQGEILEGVATKKVD